MSDEAKQQQITDRRTTILRILAFVIVVALVVPLFVFRHQLIGLQRYGYVGIFLISVAASATILIPIPSAGLTLAMGAVFNPFGIALASGLGAGIGEMSGYLAGYSGGAVIENIAYYNKTKDWLEKHKNLAEVAILILAFIPNPFFDMAGMAAGALRMPIWRFLIPCIIGKILKMLMFSYAGAYSAGWLLQ
jgi:membrane protein YqaA with SNARE-associated domain